MIGQNEVDAVVDDVARVDSAIWSMDELFGDVARKDSAIASTESAFPESRARSDSQLDVAASASDSSEDEDD